MALAPVPPPKVPSWREEIRRLREERLRTQTAEERELLWRLDGLPEDRSSNLPSPRSLRPARASPPPPPPTPPRQLPQLLFGGLTYQSLPPPSQPQVNPFLF